MQLSLRIRRATVLIEWTHDKRSESLKVPKDKFEAVVRALLNTPTMPMANIPRRRASKATARQKKRG
jgi:hypothetical protein